jgi:hypothetical protein
VDENAESVRLPEFQTLYSTLTNSYGVEGWCLKYNSCLAYQSTSLESSGSEESHIDTDLYGKKIRRAEEIEIGSNKTRGLLYLSFGSGANFVEMLLSTIWRKVIDCCVRGIFMVGMWTMRLLMSLCNRMFRIRIKSDFIGILWASIRRPEPDSSFIRRTAVMVTMRKVFQLTVL